MPLPERVIFTCGTMLAMIDEHGVFWRFFDDAETVLAAIADPDNFRRGGNGVWVRLRPGLDEVERAHARKLKLL